MRFTITNFRGIASAIIELAKITLIAGKNYSGKTSIIQAIAAVLTGNVIPIEGLLKSHAGRLVRSGSAAGEVVGDAEEAQATITYPEASRSSMGEFPSISEYAAGLKSILDEPVKSRGEIIASILKTAPTQADLQASGIPSDLLTRVWQTIEARGWDAAYAQAKDMGAKIKGKWEEVTADRYGEKKAEAWLPAAWDPELNTATEDQLKEVVRQEQEWLEVAISDQAVGEAEITRLQGIVTQAVGMKETHAELKDQVSGLFQTEATLKKALRELPVASQPDTVACPHCKKSVVIEAGKLVKPKDITLAEIAERKKAIADCEDSLKRLQGEITRVNTEMTDVFGKLRVAEDARKKLADIQAKPKSTGDKGTVEQCRAKVQRAQDWLIAFQKKAKADSLHQGIQQNVKIVEILAPQGLRLTVLKSKLQAFNDCLKGVCSVAEWGIVAVKDDMDITYGGTPYMLLSKTEQFYTRVTLQLAIAHGEHSPVILIDDAEKITNKDGRNGLFRAIATVGIPAVIAMALPERSVPDMSKLGGNAYWVETGTAERC